MQADIRLMPVAPSVRQARQFVRETLGAWNLSTLAADAELLVSELVTNAVVHAGTDITVRIEMRQRSGTSVLHVGVHDDIPGAPRAPVCAELSTAGRGLSIVQSLATDNGVRAQRGGKTVWFELAVPRGGTTRER